MKHEVVTVTVFNLWVFSIWMCFVECIIVVYTFESEDRIALVGKGQIKAFSLSKSDNHIILYHIKIHQF